MLQVLVPTMYFKTLKLFFISSMLVSLLACSDADNEDRLVDLSTTASADISAISFPDNIETIYSINSEFDFTLRGLKSNMVDVVTINKDIQWSLSAGAISQIDQRGHFNAGAIAEMITLTAKFGILSTSIDIQISAARFDQIVQLDQQTFDIDMCQSQIIRPVARYVDDDGNEEIRIADNTAINSIKWSVLNAEDSSTSQRAHIQTENNTVSLHSLAAGDIIAQARAISQVDGNEVTSADFSQTIGNGLNSIKLCRSSDADLNNCNVNSASVEKDQVISLIAVGNYQNTNGTNTNKNITRNSKWGLSNPANASTVFANNFQQMDLTGDTEQSITSIFAACGGITQSIAGIDIAQGVNLDNALSCDSSTDCMITSASITIDRLSVLSFKVEANNIELTDDESITLDQRPNEISLDVIAEFSNLTEQNITADNTLIYDIIVIADQDDVIEEDTDSAGTFTVLASGTAKIQLNYRGETFIVLIEIP